MGSKKHKKHKSERREKYDEKSFSLERPPGLKLILKVGSNSTPEHGSDSPAYGIQSNNEGGSGLLDFPERHKKSKKKKKKKDREKRHKHHKEKRRHREDSSQEDISISEDTTQFQENIMRYSGISTSHSLASMPITKPMIPLKSPEREIIKFEDDVPDCHMIRSQSMNSVHIQSKVMDSAKSMYSFETGREPRTCVLKLKQSKTPLTKLLEHLLKSLEKRDPHQFFAWPVTDDIAPGYSTIIPLPMDFSTIRQKIEENLYNTLSEFSDDFRLMCENAIRYNHVETVYHKAAKRLLHVGARLLQPENLIRSLRPLMNYMRELSSKELGFELPSASSTTLENQENENTNTMDSGDEGGVSTEEGITSQNEEDEKRKIIRLENKPKSHFEPFVDDMTPEEILAQVQNASAQARSRLTVKERYNKMGFLRHNKDGSTSMKILIDTPTENTERVISLGAFTGKLQQGTGQLQSFREDRRNIAKIVKPLNYGAFSSFAPVYDSRFSNLSKEETDLVLTTYGDENAVQYAESLLEFTQNSSYASALANSLLDYLTQGEHRKTMGTLIETQLQKSEQIEVEKTFPDVNDVSKKYENVKVDFENLKTLSNLGLDVSFLDNIEQNMKLMEIQKKLQNQLDVNSSLIERLHQVQYERLSQPLPQHLSHISKPNLDEIQIAAQLTSNLTEMAKQLTPGVITPTHGIRKAMGMTNIGLETFQHIQQRITNMNHNQNMQNDRNSQNNIDIDTTPVPMDLETETVVHHQPSNHHHSVDIESELRQFLESGSGLTNTAGEDTALEQMLLD